MSTAAAALQSLAAALADGGVRVVDLTQPLHEKTPVLKLPPPFANTPGLTRHEISRYDDRGPAWAWSWLEIGEHVGTHFDAPIHWISGKDGQDLSSVPPERLVGPAVMIDKSAESAADPDYVLTVDDVRAFEAEHGALPDGGWLLLRTGWDARADDEAAFLNASDDGMPHTPGVEAECARWLAQETALVGIGVETVGTDAGGAAARARGGGGAGGRGGGEGRPRPGGARRLPPAVPRPQLLPRRRQVRADAAREPGRVAPDGGRARRRAAQAGRRHGEPDARP